MSTLHTLLLYVVPVLLHVLAAVASAAAIAVLPWLWTRLAAWAKNRAIRDLSVAVSIVAARCVRAAAEEVRNAKNPLRSDVPAWTPEYRAELSARVVKAIVVTAGASLLRLRAFLGASVSVEELARQFMEAEVENLRREAAGAAPTPPSSAAAAVVNVLPSPPTP